MIIRIRLIDHMVLFCRLAAIFYLAAKFVKYALLGLIFAIV